MKDLSPDIVAIIISYLETDNILCLYKKSKFFYAAISADIVPFSRAVSRDTFKWHDLLYNPICNKFIFSVDCWDILDNDVKFQNEILRNIDNNRLMLNYDKKIKYGSVEKAAAYISIDRRLANDEKFKNNYNIFPEKIVYGAMFICKNRADIKKLQGETRFRKNWLQIEDMKSFQLSRDDISIKSLDIIRCKNITVNIPVIDELNIQNSESIVINGHIREKLDICASSMISIKKCSSSGSFIFLSNAIFIEKFMKGYLEKCHNIFINYNNRIELVECENAQIPTIAEELWITKTDMSGLDVKIPNLILSHTQVSTYTAIYPEIRTLKICDSTEFTVDPKQFPNLQNLQLYRCDAEICNFRHLKYLSLIQCRHITMKNCYADYLEIEDNKELYMKNFDCRKIVSYLRPSIKIEGKLDKVKLIKSWDDNDNEELFKNCLTAECKTHIEYEGNCTADYPPSDMLYNDYSIYMRL